MNWTSNGYGRRVHLMKAGNHQFCKRLSLRHYNLLLLEAGWGALPSQFDQPQIYRGKVYPMTTALKTTRHATFGLMSLSLGFVLLSSIINSQPAASQQKPVSKPTGKMVTDRSRESQKKSTATSAPKPQAQASTGSSVGAVPPAKETAPKLTAAEATADATKAAQGIASHYRGGWQMFLHNPCHTGNSYIDMPPASQGRIKWTFPAEGPIDSSPAIYKGAIYFGSDDGHVYAVDEQNGKLLWRSKLGDKVKSSPAIGDGMLIVGCEDKKIYGLNNRDGKVIWSFETKDRVSSSPAVYEGVAYVGGWDGNLYALDAKSGQLRWQFPRAAESSTGAQDGSGTAAGEGAGVGNDPAVANANAAGSNTQGIPQSSLGRITSSPCIAPGMVIVTAHNGNVYALSTKDGRLVWQFRTGGKLMASPMVLDHLVYFGSWDHAFYAVDLATGKQKWKTGAAESFSIAATGTGGKIFAANDDLKLYCLDAHSGKVLWKTPINSPVPLLSSSPAIAGNMLYCGSPDANVYAIDIRNGAIKWKLKTQRPIVSSPALTNGGVCIGSQDGNLYLIN